MMLVGAVLMLAGNVGASFVTGAGGQSAGLAGLCVLQGFFYGTGMSCAFPPVIGSPASWFAKRRGVAVGLAVAGTGIGGFVIGPLTQTMIDTIGWRWALRVLGILPATVVTLLSPFMRSRLKPRQPGEFFPWQGRKLQGAKAQDSDKTFFHYEYFKDPVFSLIFFGAFIWTISYINPWMFISPFAAAEGYSASQGALLVGILNGASAFGRAGLGLLSDFTGALNALLICISITIMSTWALWPVSSILPNPQSYSLMIVFCVLYGCAGGGFVSLIPTTVASLYGVNGIATRLGVLFFCYPIPGLISGPIGGQIIDRYTTINADGTKSQDFLPLIIYTAAILTAGGSFFFVTRIYKGRGKAWNTKM